MFKKSIISIMVASSILSGCTGVDIPADKELKDTDVVPQAVERFKGVPGVTEIQSKTINIIEQNKIPDSISNKNIEVSLSREATFEDLNEMLNKSVDLNLYFTENVDSEDEIYIKNFKGKVGDLLEIISSIYNVSFNYSSNGNIFVGEKSEYLINVPQDEDIMSEIATAIETVGAEDVETSLLGGTILYKANPQQQKKVSNYIKMFKKNAAIIGLQVAVVTVTMDKNNNKGFDWGKMQATFGQGVGNKAYQNKLNSYGTQSTGGSTVINNPITGDTTDTGDGTTDTGDTTSDVVSETVSNVAAIGSSLSSMKSFLEVSSAGSALSLIKGDFTFTSVINYLSTYGQTKTNQSVLMRTLSGKEVSLRSGQSIPYVSGVSNTSSGVSGNVSSSTETDTAEIGITLELKPYYDSNSKMVTTELSLDLSSILSFLELSAGNEIGTITQPNTQEQSFTNMITLPAGEATIVGGITYESLTDNRTGIAYIEKAKIANQNKTTNRSAVFILLRPTVTVFVDEE